MPQGRSAAIGARRKKESELFCLHNSINSKDEERMRGRRRPRVVYSPKVRKSRNSSGKHSFEIAELGDGQEEDDHTAPTKKKTKMPPSEQRSCVPSSNAEEILEEKLRSRILHNEDEEKELEANHGMSQSYFRVKEGNGPSKKSVNKISDIGVVEEQELREALAKLIPKHEKEQGDLMQCYRTCYQKWKFQLSCGFGLLFYGFGSKKTLLEDFAKSALMDGAAIVVNGYLPSVNIKHVVFTIANILWETKKKMKKKKQSASAKQKKTNGCTHPVSSNSLEDLLAFLTGDEELTPVYVIVHNIDGPGVRDDDTQLTLASVAASRHVRFLASIDNVNAPLLWDKQMAGMQFKWWWLHTPTYAAYTVEGIYVPLLLAATGTVKSLRSAALVLSSLTPNAQSVFRCLADFQIAHPDDQGLALHRLYTACREQFLVSSELTLRAHLTEFKDHELLNWRRGLDGQDCVYIPLPLDALTKLMEDLSK